MVPVVWVARPLVVILIPKVVTGSSPCFVKYDPYCNGFAPYFVQVTIVMDRAVKYAAIESIPGVAGVSGVRCWCCLCQKPGGGGGGGWGVEICREKILKPFYSRPGTLSNHKC